MNLAITVLLILAILTLVLVFFLRKKNPGPLALLPDNSRSILNEYALFYRNLDEAGKKEFEHRMQVFLSRVRITGIKTTVDDIDKVLIAASAIIPIFGFPDWEYINLNEVLLYPGSFNHDFEQQGSQRDVLGMVGSGPYQNVMILSKGSLREGFVNSSGKSNTAIHEFVHLIDKTDGAVDGIPEFLLSKQYILPWLDLMQKEMKQILSEESDINPYGATNQAEFFAVVAEYFFERPDLLEAKHPELYHLLATIFRTKPGVI